MKQAKIVHIPPLDEWTKNLSPELKVKMLRVVNRRLNNLKADMRRERLSEKARKGCDSPNSENK
jgi:hypothetical protein